MRTLLFALALLRTLNAAPAGELLTPIEPLAAGWTVKLFDCEADPQAEVLYEPDAVVEALSQGEWCQAEASDSLGELVGPRLEGFTYEGNPVFETEQFTYEGNPIVLGFTYEGNPIVLEFTYEGNPVFETEQFTYEGNPLY